MKLKYSYKKGFTMAELLVLLLVMSLLLAAFAPVFSGRKTGLANADKVWSFLSGDDTFNVVPNVVSDTLSNQYFIGLTPTSDEKARVASENAYAKLVVRSADRLPGGKIQKQFRFHSGSSDVSSDSVVGTMFAGNDNILLGGIYNNITSSAVGNTAFGGYSLNDLTTGYNNTAIGYGAGRHITSGYNNTVVGSLADVSTTGYNNTVLGYNSSVGGGGNHDNVVVNAKVVGNYNTVLFKYPSDNVINSNGDGYNTIVGSALNKSSLENFKYNTVFGVDSFTDAKSGSEYNTIIGYGAANKSRKFKKITCIGYRSCENLNTGAIPDEDSDASAVFIGRAPKKTSSEANYSGIAPLEVYSYPNGHYPVYGQKRKFKDGVYKIDSLGKPYDIDFQDVEVLPLNWNDANQTSAFPNSSVVVRGNLIVRGQSYFMTKSPLYGGPALVGFTLLPVNVQYLKDNYYDPDGNLPGKIVDDNSTPLVFSGMDGAGATHPIFGDYYGTLSGATDLHWATPHAHKGLRQNCTCARPYYISDYYKNGLESGYVDSYGNSKGSLSLPTSGMKSADAFNSYAWRYIEDYHVAEHWLDNANSKTEAYYGYAPLFLANVCAAITPYNGTNSASRNIVDPSTPKDVISGDHYPSHVYPLYYNCPRNVRGNDIVDDQYWDSNGNPVVGGRYYDYSIDREYFLENMYLSLPNDWKSYSGFGNSDFSEFIYGSTAPDGYGYAWHLNSSHVHLYNQVLASEENSLGSRSDRWIKNFRYSGDVNPSLYGPYDLISTFPNYRYALHNSAYIDYNMAREMTYPVSKNKIETKSNQFSGCCPPVSHPLGSYKAHDSFQLYDGFKPYSLFHVSGVNAYFSDLALKNVIGEFTSGLESIKRLKIYNFTFKDDKEKSPHVGVIAQDLKRVFPESVQKDPSGYYRIRWEEMLYSSINAVKELNSKIENLANRVKNDVSRIAKLKKDNAHLVERLNDLSKQVDELETANK